MTKRITAAPIGEYYEDLLLIDARINARSLQAHTNSLLCAKLQEREQRIKERVAYLAQKRGIPFEEMWQALLKGDKLAADEVGEEE